MKRIARRLIVLGVVYILMIYILPALITMARGISSFFKSIPSWGYYTCCSLGFVLLAIMVIFEMQANREREQSQHKLEEIAEAFEKKIRNDPLETKQKYLELMAALRKHDEVSAIDSAEKVYGKRSIDRKLIEIFEKKLASIESDQVTEAIEVFIRKLRDNPDETRRMADDLQNAFWAKDMQPKLIIELSTALFDGMAFAYEPTSKRIIWDSYRKIGDMAVNEIKDRMGKNPELTRKTYYELEDALKKGKDSELIYELCEKLFGNRYLPIDRLSTLLILARTYIDEN